MAVCELATAAWALVFIYPTDGNDRNTKFIACTITQDICEVAAGAANLAFSESRFTGGRKATCVPLKRGVNNP